MDIPLTYMLYRFCLTAMRKRLSPLILTKRYTKGRHVPRMMLIDLLWLLAPPQDFHCNQPARGWAEASNWKFWTSAQLMSA